MHGFGPVVPEENEPVFHAEWERRLAGLTFSLAAAGFTNSDEFRYAVERMEPARYLSTTYYEHWLHAIETLLIEKGTLTRNEFIAAGVVPPQVSVSRRSVAGIERRKSDQAEQPARRAGFKRGNHVVTRNINPVGHTRMPRYVRGKPGVVVRELGLFTFPDSNALGAGRKSQPCYTICFKARDLWGDDAGKRDRLYIDLWEDYLKPDEARRRGKGGKS